MYPGIRILFLGAAAVLGTACSHPQRPYAFTGGVRPERATRILVDTLTAEGFCPAMVDPNAGVIVTTWVDTGYRFHEEASFNENAIDVERTVLRRYHVAVVADDAAGGASVRLQAETQRCTPDVTIRNQHLLGDCKELDKFFPGLQIDMDQLGQKLRQATSLHATDPAPPPARSVAQSGH